VRTRVGSATRSSTCFIATGWPALLRGVT